jgi:predicted MPP superfamily phosphohydrolase
MFLKQNDVFNIILFYYSILIIILFYFIFKQKKKNKKKKIEEEKKEIFITVSDLHFGSSNMEIKNFNNFLKNKFILNEEWKKKNLKINLILLGDVFDLWEIKMEEDGDLEKFFLNKIFSNQDVKIFFKLIVKICGLSEKNGFENCKFKVIYVKG